MNKKKAIVVPIWLGVMIALVLLMVAVGGLTRLTGSGLSMVDWKPIMGAFPPLNQADWQDHFNAYQQYPEYKVLRPDMTLDQFKSIFIWEYAHRVLGRLIGVVFLLPYLFFLVRKKIPEGYQVKIFVAFLLGGAQGLLGWYMVKSGLVDNPRVSHFRLAAHFCLALVVMAYLYWNLLSLVARRPEGDPPAGHKLIRIGVHIWSLLFAVQMVWGAFVAGLDAGYVFNTFPKMMGQWIPPGFHAMTPLWSNYLNNPATVQFIHRVLGGLLLVGVLDLWASAFLLKVSSAVRRNISILSVLVLVQVVFGIATLVMHMPVTIASFHQINACLILLCLLNLMFSLKQPRSKPASVNPA